MPVYLRERKVSTLLKRWLQQWNDHEKSHDTVDERSVLVDIKKQSNDSAIEDIKKFADAVVIKNLQSFPYLMIHCDWENQCSGEAAEIKLILSLVGRYHGTITEFPFTASKYKKESILSGTKENSPYMPLLYARSPTNGESFISSPSSQHSSKPSSKPVFKDDYVAGPPLPPNLIFTNDGRYKLCSQPFSCAIRRIYCTLSGYLTERVRLPRLYAQLQQWIRRADCLLRENGLYRQIFVLKSTKYNEQFNQSALQFADGTKLLTILYDCRDLPSNISNSLVYNYIFNVRKIWKGKRNYCFVKNSSSALLYMRDGTKDLEKNCKKEVSIPVRESTLPSLCSDNPNKSLERNPNGLVDIIADSSVIVTMGLMDITVWVFVNAIHKGSWVNVILKVAGSIAGVVLFVILLLFFRHYLRMKELRLETTESEVPHSLKHYTYAKVKRITSHLRKWSGEADLELGASKKMALVGLWCIQPSPLDRPPMKQSRRDDGRNASKACLAANSHGTSSGISNALSGELYRLCSKKFSCCAIRSSQLSFLKTEKHVATQSRALNCREILQSSTFHLRVQNHVDSDDIIRKDYIDNLYPRNPLNAQFNENVVSFPYNTELKKLYVTKNTTSPLLEEIRGLLNISGNKCQYSCHLDLHWRRCRGVRIHIILRRLLNKVSISLLNSDCERCMVSEGACGYNQTSSAFVCYCKDGPHNSSCPTHNRKFLSSMVLFPNSSISSSN
ncbi:LOW QUALITY PROTEIN: hypothetical protein HID58_095351 [Brassica napus]|uniref:glycerophosphodiester phosphodiesterase n=1 Tax=Brassica napus TaxID=3708 RepID=A0ABQ7X3Y1_BRANA|nr:LOW QUALITY PROTEIN: hypothetical protein HID58_095351 [Brassica napus]